MRKLSGGMGGGPSYGSASGSRYESYDNNSMGNQDYNNNNRYDREEATMTKGKTPDRFLFIFLI